MTADKNWQGKNKKIVNVAGATEANDAVAYKQVMHSDTDKWYGDNKRFSNVKPGIENGDVATFDQIMVLEDEEAWNAKNHKIKNVDPATKDGEVVTYEQAIMWDGEHFKMGDETIFLYHYGSNEHDHLKVSKRKLREDEF